MSIEQIEQVKEAKMYLNDVQERLKTNIWERM